jgi:hypothetical protein
VDSSDNDEATAALIRDTSGTVFTTGDNAYGTASEAPFDLYYEFTWGTEKTRTKPTPAITSIRTRQRSEAGPSTSTTSGRWLRRTTAASTPTSSAIGTSSP